MPKVEVKRVSWSTPEAFARDVVVAFRSAGLSLGSAMLLAAHAALSTGWGGRSKGGLPNFMLSGIKATSESQTYIELGGFEVVNGREVRGMMKWRAFSSLAESAGAMVRQLQVKRYKTAWDLLQAGNPDYFEEVGRCGWYTADVESTGRQMRRALAQIQQWMAAAPSSSGVVVLLLAAAGAALFYFGVR